MQEYSSYFRADDAKLFTFLTGTALKRDKTVWREDS